MSEPKRPRVRRDKCALNEEEMRVMKHVRFNVKMDDGKLQGSTISFFAGNAAVDCLMKSKYAGKVPTAVTGPHFPDRKAAVAFMNRAMQTGLFMRVDRRKRRVERESEAEKASGLRKRTAGSSEKAEGASSGVSNKESETKAKKEAEKVKKTPKLTIHDDQAFLDSEAAIYTWNYDPLRPRNVILGLLLVVAAIAICLYPIWPHELKIYTAYASRGGLVVVLVLLVALLLRYALASLVYMVTWGRVSFWLFPNLNDDKLGVVDSFKPVYTLSYNDSTKDKSKEKEKDKVVTSSKKDSEKQKRGGDERTSATKVTSDDNEKKRSKKSGNGKGKGTKQESIASSLAAESEPVSTINVPVASPDASCETPTVATRDEDEEEDSQYEVINKDEL